MRGQRKFRCVRFILSVIYRGDRGYNLADAVDWAGPPRGPRGRGIPTARMHISTARSTACSQPVRDQP